MRRTRGKLVRVVAGTIFDVAVDLRRSSPTFGRWTGDILRTGNKTQLWMPEGFAHGFLVLSEAAEVVYKQTDYYAPIHERCVAWNDPALRIAWPIKEAPLVSAKDGQGTFLEDAELFP